MAGTAFLHQEAPGQNCGAANTAQQSPRAAPPAASPQLGLPVQKRDVKKRYRYVLHSHRASGTYSTLPIFAEDHCPGLFPRPMLCCTDCTTLYRLSRIRGPAVLRQGGAKLAHTVAKRQQDERHRVRLGKAFSILPSDSLKTN